MYIPTWYLGAQSRKPHLFILFPTTMKRRKVKTRAHVTLSQTALPLLMAGVINVTTPSPGFVVIRHSPGGTLKTKTTGNAVVLIYTELAYIPEESGEVNNLNLQMKWIGL